MSERATRYVEAHVIVAFPMTPVPSASSAWVRTRSTNVFKPLHLVVPKTVAPNFAVKAFMIGKNSQFNEGQGSIPAECFSGDVEAFSLDRDSPQDFLKKADLAVPLPLRFDTCTPHHDLCVEVENLSCCAQNFWAVLYGTLVE